MNTHSINDSLHSVSYIGGDSAPVKSQILTGVPSPHLRWMHFLRLLVLISCFLGVAFPTTAQSFDRETIGAENNTNILLERGKKQYEAGQLREAIATFQDALRSLDRQGKTRERATTLLYLSWAYQALGQYEEAERTILQSIDLLSEGSPALLLAKARSSLARLQLTRGQLEDARVNWEMSAILYRQANDRIGQLGSQLNQAQALEEMGRYRLACDGVLAAFGTENLRCKTLDKKDLRLVLQTIQQESDPELKGLGLRSLAVSLQALGSLEASREAIAASLAVFQTLDRPSEIARGLFVSANTERFLGEKQRALELYAQAAQMARRQETPEAAIVALESLANQLNLLIESEDFETAEVLFREIRPLMSLLPASEPTIYAQLNVLRSWLQLRQKQENSADYREIARFLASLYQEAKKMNNPRTKSQILGTLGYLYGENDRLEDAIALTERALDIAHSIEVEFRYEWQGQLARFLEMQGETETAIAIYWQAIETFEELRLDLMGLNPKIRYNFRDRVEPIYRSYIRLQLASLPTKEDLKKEKLENVKKAIEGLRVVELEDYLQEVCLTHQSPEESEKKLATIYTIILRDRVEILASLPNDNLQYYPAQIASTELEELTVQLRQSFSPIFPPQRHLQYAQKLYNKILKPIESDLAANEIETLAFVPDGALQNVPMSALHDGESYLLEEYELVVIPGLQLLKERSPNQLELKAIAAGLSEARDSFIPLPAVTEEVAAIAEHLPSEILLNEQLTAANLQKVLSDRPFPILHLATHGQFSAQLDDTFLLMWDGRLTLNAFANLLWERESGKAIPLELLVLSACQTAKGDDRAALGLAGMSVRSGARSTLASLWSVNDESTARLMVTFYQFLVQFQGDRAKALRRAQLSLLQDPAYQQPYYWAPFILVGHWR